MIEAEIRVMVVDDHIFWRKGVQQIIDAEADMCVVAEAADGEHAVPAALASDPDVVLMDVNMPGTNGIEATREIVNQRPSTRIVMLSVSNTDTHLLDSIKAGAVGFLTKDVSPDDLVRAVRNTVAGESPLSPFVASRLVRYIQQDGSQDESQPAANLTGRENEILRLIAGGDRDREIAEQLFISESTVKKHVQNMLRKLHARNRVEAVSYLDRVATSHMHDAAS